MNGSGTTRTSKQRRAVLRILQENRVHPTAEWIYAKVREELPSISLGTVYRNLARLAQEGLIQRLDAGDGTDRFDGEARPHYHLYCERCHRLLDLKLPYDPTLNRRAEALHQVTVHGHSLIFHGVCGDCQKDTRKKEKIETIN